MIINPNPNLISRITLIENLLIPKINYVFISLPPVNKRQLFTYIIVSLWKFKADKVKRAVITEDCCSGCMKIVDKNVTSLLHHLNVHG